MRILFITRKYPPAIGGMETFSAGFVAAFGADVTVLALRRRSQLHLVWWLPYSLIKALTLAGQHDLIHLGDGVLAGVGVMLRWFTTKPVTVTLHGLDLTFNRYGYQRYLHWALPRLSSYVAVSEATALECQHRFKLMAKVIPNGISVQDWPLNNALGQNRCILFVGRLVERKGCAWFIEQVLPQLPDVQLHVVGTGPQLERCQELVQQLSLEQHVRFHGRVSAQQLREQYCQAQALVMPNIEVAEDMEGFGLVAIEAGACGLPVVAANTEGIRCALIDGTTGFLVKSADATAWVKAIQEILQAPLSSATIRQAVQQQFSWDKSAQQYRVLFKELIS